MNTVADPTSNDRGRRISKEKYQNQNQARRPSKDRTPRSPRSPRTANNNVLSTNVGRMTDSRALVKEEATSAKVERNAMIEHLRVAMEHTEDTTLYQDLDKLRSGHSAMVGG